LTFAYRNNNSTHLFSAFIAARRENLFNYETIYKGSCFNGILFLTHILLSFKLNNSYYLNSQVEDCHDSFLALIETLLNINFSVNCQRFKKSAKLHLRTIMEIFWLDLQHCA